MLRIGVTLSCGLPICSGQALSSRSKRSGNCLLLPGSAFIVRVGKGIGQPRDSRHPWFRYLVEALSQSIDLLHAKRPIQTIERPIKWANLPVGLCCSFWWSLGNATASGLSVKRHRYMGAAPTLAH